MKTIILIFALLMLASCEEEVQMYDKLTAAERAAIEQRSELKCLTDTENTFEQYGENSNDKLLELTRNDSWKFEYKKDNTVIETSYLYVWKVSAPNVYFRFKLTQAGVTKNQFIKIDTSSNEDIIRNIQEKKCSKALTVSQSETNINMKVEVKKSREDADTVVDTITDYRMPVALPAYFSVLNRTLTKKSYNNDEELQKTEKFEYIFTRISDVTQPATYTDSDISSREFCVVKYTDPTPPDTRDDYAFPFTLLCETGNVDVNGDAVIDFTPATELVIP